MKFNFKRAIRSKSKLQFKLIGNYKFFKYQSEVICTSGNISTQFCDMAASYFSFDSERNFFVPIVSQVTK